MSSLSKIATCKLALVLCRSAGAQELETDRIAAASAPDAAGLGAASPLVLSAALGPQRALAISDGGYDSSRRGAIFDSAAEVRVWGPVALRASVSYSNDTQRMRPSVGARVQLLRQAAHGVDGSLTGSFRTEGFNEPEGEIEATFALGRRFQHLYLLGNVAYGQDPEGNERDGEIRASVLVPMGRMVWGLESRNRFTLGAQHGAPSAVEPRFDAVGGAVGMVSLSSFVLFAELGPSVFKLQNADTRWGVAAVSGVAAVF